MPSIAVWPIRRMRRCASVTNATVSPRRDPVSGTVSARGRRLATHAISISTLVDQRRYTTGLLVPARLATPSIVNPA